jgi:hypothetical protein
MLVGPARRLRDASECVALPEPADQWCRTGEKLVHQPSVMNAGEGLALNTELTSTIGGGYHSDQVAKMSRKANPLSGSLFSATETPARQRTYFNIDLHVSSGN